MVNYFDLRYLAYLMFVPYVKAGSHKYSLVQPSSVRYTDVSAYHEETSVMQCMAICDGTDDCKSINYNVDTERCELSPQVPRTQTPDSTAEPNWRVYYSDRIIPAVQAWQKSTFTQYNILLNASYAIDGNHDNNDHGWYLYCSCTQTSNDYTYWAMEFKYAAQVEYVTLLFRNNTNNNHRNQKLQLLISPTREAADEDIGSECAFYAGPPASPSLPVKIVCTQPVTGKFLKIIQNPNSFITLCEVEVYSV